MLCGLDVRFGCLRGLHRTEQSSLRYRRYTWLQACRQLERKITELRARTKAETQFNRQVESNMNIESPQDRLTQEAAML